MISLKITHSPDPVVLGDIKVGFNEFFVGRKSGNLIVEDEEFYEVHLRFLVTDNGKFLVMAASPGAQFAVGGKLLSEPIEIDKDILVTVGRTNILVVDYEFSNYDAFFDESNFSPGSPEKRILDIIEEESND